MTNGRTDFPADCCPVGVRRRAVSQLYGVRNFSDGTSSTEKSPQFRINLYI